MKNRLLILVVVCMIVQVNGQQKNIFTKSVKMEEFILFVIQNYKKEKDAVKTKNITFLVPINTVENDIENTILLKQGFRLLSSRLSKEDKITIVAYNALNGIALNAVSPKDIETILYTLKNVESSISETVKDGIQLGYENAKVIFDDNAVNSVVLIRNTNLTLTAQKSVKTKEKRKKNHTVLLTLISLVPELVRVIKNEP